MNSSAEGRLLLVPNTLDLGTADAAAAPLTDVLPLGVLNVAAGPLPSRPAVPSGAEPGHAQSGGLFVPGEGLACQGERGPQGRPTYPSDEGLT